MRRFLGAVVVVVWAMALLTPAFAGDEMVEKGKEVYAQYKCKMCHSIEGTGNKKGPLDDVGSKFSAEEIKAWIVDAKGMAEKTKAERKPKMKNYEMPDEELEALVAYMASLKTAE